MKINNIPGEFGFKALVKSPLGGWFTSWYYYLTLEEAIKQHGLDVKWPVEIREDGTIYIPDEEELE